MLWPQTYITVCVALFMIPAQCIEAGRTCGFVEPDRWEQPTRSLNALHGRALALVRDCLNLKPGSRDVILEPGGGHGIHMRGIMGENAKRRAVAVCPKPFQMRSERLTNSLVMIQNADFSPRTEQPRLPLHPLRLCPKTP